MRVIEEHRKDLDPKKNPKYIYRCSHCGSVLEVEESDIKYEGYYDDIEECFTCPVCKHSEVVFCIRLFHRKWLRGLFNKKYR